MTLGMLTRALNDALNTMKDSPSYYPTSCSVIPIHQRPDLYQECCRLINTEWPASKMRRLRSFGESCDDFPTNLILLRGEQLIGHCKLSLINSEYRSCFLGSVVIDNDCRSQGYGTILLRGAEEYAAVRQIEKMYLTTKGQEGFYSKNGYAICPPVNVWNYIIVSSVPTSSRPNNEKSEAKASFGPPPPPMPKPVLQSSDSSLNSSKTFMVKRL